MSRHYHDLDDYAATVTQTAQDRGDLQAMAIIGAALIIGKELAAVSASIDSLTDAVSGINDTMNGRVDDHSADA